MRVSLAALGKQDRLTNKELPFLEADEWVSIRAIRDVILDGKAEVKAWAEARVEAEALKMPPPTSIAQALVWRWRFEYMFCDWNLYEPAGDDGYRVPIEKTEANREKFFSIYGLELMAEMMKRGGGLAGLPVKEVGPDGEPPSFQEGDRVPAAG